MVGKEFEDIAMDFLKSNGFEILARNYRIRGGEIDIIARSGRRDIYFIEVRHRGRGSFARAFETITRKKKQAIIKTALNFIKESGLYKGVEYHFSVADVGEDRVEEILWDAFTLEEAGLDYSV